MKTILSETVIDTDLLIIGSEGSGSMAAIEASKRNIRVVVVTKGRIRRSGATLTGGADISVDSKSLHDMGFKGTDLRDSQDIFFEDMVKSGKYMNNQKLVEVHVREAPARLKDLIDWGAKIWPMIFGASGHRFPRGAFIWGYEVSEVLKNEILKHNIEVMEYIMATDLLTHNNRVTGAVGLNIQTGDFIIFKAKAIVLATGGMMEIYPYSTAPVELTGDGQAMAYRAGAELVDMEFPMFLPAVFAWPPSMQGILFPYTFTTAGEGYIIGWLLNKHGQRFMKKWDPERMELTTRDIASIAIMSEVLEGRGSPHGGVYASVKHLPDNLIEYYKEWGLYKNFKWGTLDYKEFIPDLHKDAMEVIVAAHFTNGGIRINEYCETNIPGLFACGEVTGGLHGANRLSGNAFSEFLVWGTRAGAAAAEYALNSKVVTVDVNQVEKLRKRVYLPLERKEGLSPITLKKEIKKLAWNKVGVVRNRDLLEDAINEIERIKKQVIPQICLTNKEMIFNREWVDALEAESMINGLEMHARAALMRKESRGAHYRTDYPSTDNKNWFMNIIVKLVDTEMQLTTRPVIVPRMKPPDEIMPYWIPR